MRTSRRLYLPRLIRTNSFRKSRINGFDRDLIGRLCRSIWNLKSAQIEKTLQRWVIRSEAIQGLSQAVVKTSYRVSSIPAKQKSGHRRGHERRRRDARVGINPTRDHIDSLHRLGRLTADIYKADRSMIADGIVLQNLLAGKIG